MLLSYLFAHVAKFGGVKCYLKGHKNPFLSYDCISLGHSVGRRGGEGRRGDGMGGEGGHTSSSSGALDSLAAVLKTLGVNDTEMEPDVLGSGTGFSNMSFFLAIKEGRKTRKLVNYHIKNMNF